MLNKLLINGRLCKNVELKQTNNVTYAVISVAVTREYKDKQTGNYESDFFNIQVFGKTAEYIAKYGKKGSLIALECHVQNNIYERDGERHFDNNFICESCNGIYETKPKENTQDQQAQMNAQRYAQPVQQPTQYQNPYNYNSQNDREQLNQLNQQQYQNPFTTTPPVNDNDLPF